MVKRPAAAVKHLEVISAFVASAAKNESAFVRILEVRFDRVKTHVWRKRDAVGAETLEGFLRIMLGR